MEPTWKIQRKHLEKKTNETMGLANNCARQMRLVSIQPLFSMSFNVIKYALCVILELYMLHILASL
jgi:hypothetical protein